MVFLLGSLDIAADLPLTWAGYSHKTTLSPYDLLLGVTGAHTHTLLYRQEMNNLNIFIWTLFHAPKLPWKA